jgi:hypothetical protein
MGTAGMVSSFMKAGWALVRPRVAAPAGCALALAGFYLDIGFVAGVGVGLLIVVLLNTLKVGFRW